MLDSVRLSGKVAFDFIRRRGLTAFLRRLPPLREVLTLLFPRRVAFAEGQDVIGDLVISRGEELDPHTGVVRGWVLSRGEPIDRVEIFLDQQPVENVRIAVPHPITCRGMPDAAVCGFRAFLPAGARNDGAPIPVRAIGHGFSGSTYPIATTEIRLRPEAASAPVEIRHPTAIDRRRINPKGHVKIRVACFTHNMDYGGAQLFLWELLRRARLAADLEFIVFSAADGPLVRDMRELGFTVELLREPDKTDGSRHDRETAALALQLRERAIDCVLGNTLLSFFAVNAAAQAGIPSIWAIHESFSLPVWSALYTAGRPVGAFVTSRLEGALARASCVTFVAEATRRLYLKRSRSENFLHIPYGIDTAAIVAFLSTFDRAALRAQHAIAPDEFVFLCLGNFEARKQQILLAQAFAEVSRLRPDAVLLLVGELPSLYSAILRKYVLERDMGQRIRLVPAVRQTYPWYGIADAFVLLSDVESMPRALMEAMAFGLPILATNVFGIPELIEDGLTGFLAQPNSRLSAVKGLERLLRLSSEQRHAMAQAAKEKVFRENDSRSYAEAYEALIRRLTGAHESHPPEG